MTTITSHRGSPSQVTEAAQPVPASPLDAEDLRPRVDRALAALLDRELSALGFLGPDAGPVTDALTRFAMEGGKRLRPAFVYWGYRGAGGAAGGLAAALRVFNRLRSELMGGQYLDLVEARRGAPDEDAVRRVLTYKSGKYTIERPLHLGLALAAGDPRLAAAYSAYGLPLGEAFQLRDDILGVFGSPEVTGKPAGDDLREGKETYLVMLARQRAGRAGRQLLESALGNAKLSEDDVADLRRLITDCGAVAATEDRIAVLLAEAKDALAAAEGVAEPARVALAALADQVTDRSA